MVHREDGAQDLQEVWPCHKGAGHSGGWMRQRLRRLTSHGGAASQLYRAGHHAGAAGDRYRTRPARRALCRGKRGRSQPFSRRKLRRGPFFDECRRVLRDGGSVYAADLSKRCIHIVDALLHWGHAEEALFTLREANRRGFATVHKTSDLGLEGYFRFRKEKNK